ncbi:hypothetical protein Tco_0708518 [Tanacetum coccineum]
MRRMGKRISQNSNVDNQDGSDIDICRTESKHVSDCLVYLLVTYPVMLSIGIGLIRYRDTCAEAMRFFKEKGLITEKVEACLKILEVDSLEAPPLTLKKMEKERLLLLTAEDFITSNSLGTRASF